LGGAVGAETAAAWSASIVSMTAINLSLTPILAWLRDREPIISTLRCTVDRGFAYSFVYFALSGTLVAGVLDGRPKGYVLSLLAAALSVSLVEMLAQERARRQLEEEILDHKRYVARTRAAEGLFHGLRNHHAVVRHALDELELEREESSDALSRAQRAIRAASDQLNMVANSIHGATAGSLRTIDLGGVASDAAVIYTAFARSQEVKILTRCRPGVLVKGDEFLLKDVVGNLIKNAVEASARSTEVQLTVRPNGDRALLVVEDRGPGLDPSHRERLFEPHFTTKASGTGLGLFTAYGVIRQHRGRLVYADRLGGGAVFTVELPLFVN
jgi:signal transduction histidine kinase